MDWSTPGFSIPGLGPIGARQNVPESAAASTTAPEANPPHVDPEAADVGEVTAAIEDTTVAEEADITTGPKHTTTDAIVYTAEDANTSNPPSVAGNDVEGGGSIPIALANNEPGASSVDVVPDSKEGYLSVAAQKEFVDSEEIVPAVASLNDRSPLPITHALEAALGELDSLLGEQDTAEAPTAKDGDGDVDMAETEQVVSPTEEAARTEEAPEPTLATEDVRMADAAAKKVDGEESETSDEEGEIVEDDADEHGAEKAGQAKQEQPTESAATQLVTTTTTGLGPMLSNGANGENGAAGEAGREGVEWEVDSSPYESSSESSSDSDDDDDSEEDGYQLPGLEDTVRMLMEDVSDDDDSDDGKPHTAKHAASAAKVRTKNETTDEVLPKPQVTITEEMKIEELGTITSIVGNTVLITATTDGMYHVLDTGSVVCTSERKVLAAICDTLGKVESPLYVVRFPLEEMSNLGLEVGTKTYYSVPHAKFALTKALMGMKGTDASNIHDEECPDEDSSDDDIESKKKKKRAKRKQPSDMEAAAAALAAEPSTGPTAHAFPATATAGGQRPGSGGAAAVPGASGNKHKRKASKANAGKMPYGHEPKRPYGQPREYDRPAAQDLSGGLNYDDVPADEDDDDGPYRVLSRPTNFGQGPPRGSGFEETDRFQAGGRGGRGRGGRGGRGGFDGGKRGGFEGKRGGKGQNRGGRGGRGGGQNEGHQRGGQHGRGRGGRGGGGEGSGSHGDQQLPGGVPKGPKGKQPQYRQDGGQVQHHDNRNDQHQSPHKQKQEHSGYSLQLQQQQGYQREQQQTQSYGSPTLAYSQPAPQQQAATFPPPLPPPGSIPDFNMLASLAANIGAGARPPQPPQAAYAGFAPPPPPQAAPAAAPAPAAGGQFDPAMFAAALQVIARAQQGGVPPAPAPAASPAPPPAPVYGGYGGGYGAPQQQQPPYPVAQGQVHQQQQQIPRDPRLLAQQDPRLLAQQPRAPPQQQPPRDPRRRL